MTKLFSVTEAADAMGISRHTVNAWKSKKLIPYIKLGRRTLFDPDDLAKFIEIHKIEATKH